MIQVQDLNLNFKDKKLLENVSFTLKKGRNLAILGKSGSGKSTLAKCLIKLFDKNYTLSAKRLEVAGFDVLNLNSKDLEKLRLNIAYIFQDALASFYPLLDMGAIFHIALKRHTNLTKAQRKELAFAYFDKLRLRDKDLIWHSYAYQLSGGMAMRVQFALALACGAKSLICDELTSSLDKENRARISALLKGLNKNLILISHDLEFIKDLSDDVLILDSGKVLEYRDKNEFFSAPKSAYAKELLQSFKELSCSKC